MRAIAIKAFGGREELKLMDLPKPHVGPGEVLIAIKAAAVNPVDWKIRAGRVRNYLPYTFPIIMGWDAAGSVEAVGEGISRFHVGDEVFAYAKTDRIEKGTYAEYISLPEKNVALKPKNLSFEEAAALPDAGLTAYQSLFDVIKLKRDEKILIHAAAGGVGGFAVQLAKDCGAYVMATASSKNHDHVRMLGADLVIDYRSVDFRDVVKGHHPEGLDAAYDTIGGDVLQRSADVLKTGGRLVSVVEPPDRELSAVRGIRAWFVGVRADPLELEALAALADQGRLKVTIAACFDLADAAKAHEMSESGHTRGKIVIRI